MLPRPFTEFDHAFEELPLFGGFTDWRKDEWTYGAMASGTATIRVHGPEEWCVSDIAVTSHRRGRAGEPVWVSQATYLHPTHPLFGLIKAALEGPAKADIEAAIAERRGNVLRMGRAA